jgi:Ca2+-binding RTX toxin-like protein
MKTTVSSVLLAGTLVLAPVLPAHAAPNPAPPQCQGRAATLVGSPGTKHLMGTAGADVVVTGGASRVDTDNGDDVVCVTGRTRGGKRMNLDTGAGNDAVTVTAHNAVRVRLGDGDDTFFGRSEADTVLAGYFDDGLVDTGVDAIHTGAGPDDVRSNGGNDTISLGKGADDLQWGPATRTADGGRGRDSLYISALAADSVVDNRTGTLTEDGQVVSRWASFADFAIGGRVTLVLGSGEDETFATSRVGIVSGAWTIRAGGGDDVMSGTKGDDTLIGGPGHDRADGRRGDDLCKVERSERCERH